MYTFKRVEAENFMAFRTLDIDLSSYRGVTLIAGERGGVGRSNGAGKTTLFNAIHYALFGKLTNGGTKASEVMHRWMRPEERTVVRLTIEVDGREVLVERGRTRTGPTLRLHEEGKASGSSTVDGVQDRIEAIIGKTERTFGCTDMFSGAVAQFCQLTDADRKQLLEAMTGADSYHATAKLADERLRDVGVRLHGSQQRASIAEARRDQAFDTRAQEVIRATRASPQRTARERELVKAVEQASAAARESSAALAAYHEERQVLLASQSARRAELDAEVEAAEAEEQELRAKATAIEAEVAVARSKVRDFTKQLDDIRRGTHPDICPRCGQAWPSKGPSKDHLEAEEARLTKHLAGEQAKVGPADAKLAALRTAIEDQVRRRRKATQAAHELDAAADTRRERGFLSRALSDQAALEAAMKTLSAHRQTMPEDGAYEVDTTEADKVIADLTRQLDTARAEQEQCQVLQRRLEFWRKGFGRGGLPSMLLDSAVPSMNETASRVASLLSEGELTVTFDPAAAKGRGDVFAVIAEYASGAGSYEAASRGERTRIDMAVLFALRDLVERRGSNRCTQLFLDEVMDGCDAAFAEAFVSMVRTVYKDRQVFLISHDDAIKASCDSTITVRKTGKAAEIVK